MTEDHTIRMNFIFQPLSIPDVIMLRREIYRDQRGSFSELYRQSSFHYGGVDVEFVQDNLVHSTHGVLRGLHYQLPPRAQGKLISVVQGEILDVAVDLRSRSPTFGKWAGVELCSTDGQMLWVPPGFAHGYLVLSSEACVTYKVTEEYAPELDRGIRWNDSDLSVDWPVTNPVLSEKDRLLPLFRDAENPF